jgi:shikimate 5-dehydrogenase
MTAIKVNGATRLYGIVGDPVTQVRSAEVYSELFAAKGLNAILIPLHVLPDQFDDTMRGLMALGNMDGLMVTAPYKARALPFAARLGATARCIGAVNALRRDADGTWSGDMFDGAGFVRGAQRKGETLRGRRVALYGAGGAGSAIACELAKAGVASIAILDPQAARAVSLAKDVHEAFPACATSAAASLPADADMIVNASMVGMRPGDGLPGAIDALTANVLVGDVVLSEAPTPIIQHAIRHGCRYLTGRDMHAGQIDALMAFFAPKPVSAEPPVTSH